MTDIEKVKQRIKNCINPECSCNGCEYNEYGCDEQLMFDALSVIESLQSENKILSENCDGLSKQRDDFAQTIHEQKMEIERLNNYIGYMD